jgi:hypothetical protein
MKTPEEVADKMYEMIAQEKGRKKFTARDLQSALAELFGGEVDKKICKNAIRQLMDTGRCVYSTYSGVSYVEIPPDKTSE